MSNGPTELLGDFFTADVTTEVVEQWSAEEKASCVNLDSQADCKYLASLNQILNHSIVDIHSTDKKPLLILILLQALSLL